MKTPEKGFIKLRKKAPKFLRNNFWRKVMAFLLALLIHGVVKAKYFSEERAVEVLVEVTLPEGICNTSKSTPVVSVILSGSTSELNRLSPGEVTVKGIMSENDFRDGQTTRLTLKSSWLEIPAGVRFVRFEPAVISLPHLEREVSKEVPVVPAWLEANNSEYAYAPVFMPSQVTVTGPASLLDNIEKISTVPMAVAGGQGEKTIDAVRLAVPANVTLSTEEVVATVQISRKIRTKDFDHITVFIMTNSSDNGKKVELVSGDTVKIVLSGTYSDLQSISAALLRPCLDVSSFDVPGEYNIPVFIIPPAGTKVESVYPESLKVRISSADNTSEMKEDDL